MKLIKKLLSKRAQGGLTMNTIVIAALALIALIVIAFIFISRANMFKTDVESCENKGGSCAPGNECPLGATGTDFVCQDGQVCCLGLCTLRGGVCTSSCSEENEVSLTECSAQGLVCCRNN